jgi:hypothetical protein
MFPRPSRFARKKAGAKATTPVIENKAIESVEPVEVVAVLPEVRHVGGPWFEVDGEKYMGRAAAEEALKQILEDMF